MNNSPHCMEIASNLFGAEMEFSISEKLTHWLLEDTVIICYFEPYYKIQNN